MKKNLIFLIIAIILIFIGCGSSPSPSASSAPLSDSPSVVSEPVPVTSSQDSFIWRLLRNGDDRVTGYFHGEFDVNIRDSDGKTPLHYAAERRDAPLVRFFLSQGANPNFTDNRRQTPLSIAIQNNDAQTIEALARSNADIHLEVLSGNTAAKMAFDKGGAVSRSILTTTNINTIDSYGRTVLHIASIDGNTEAVSNILEVSSQPVYINKQDNLRKNALDYSLERTDSVNHFHIAEKLILNGGTSRNQVFANISPAVRSGNYNIRSNDGISPIHYAVINNFNGLINYLIEKNVDVNLKSNSGATALHEAARNGNIPVIRLLIEQGADVNSSDAKGNTPLHTGIPEEVHTEIANLLLRNSADPNIRDEHGETPLHVAITLNRPINLIQALLDGGADVHIRNIKGQTPLYIAVNENRRDIIPLLLSYNAEIFAADDSGITPFDVALRKNTGLFNLLVTPQTVSQRDTAGNTILHATIRNRGTPDQIAFILNQRPLVDATNRAGDTALHIAVRTNQQQSGEFLISRGANIFSNNAAGESPIYLALTSSNGIRQWMINPTTILAKDGLGNNMLHYAAQWNINNAIPLIINRGIPVNEANVTGETPIFMAVKTDSTSTIRILSENKANINARDKQGNSLLHTAVRWNAVRSAQLLISSGMDVNVYSLNGNTPLHDAVILGMSDLETLLIRQKADLEVRNIEGNTPFMEAVRGGHTRSMQRLASAGADTSTRNINGDTPLHMAVSMNQPDTVRVLLNMGSSIHAKNTGNRSPFQLSFGVSNQMVTSLLTRDRINQSDDAGSSALHIALHEKSSVDVLMSILRLGAQINAVDGNGKTPLRIAVDTEMWEHAKLLADSGANPFIAAVDNKTPAELAFQKGDTCIKALFSGRAINTKDNSENTILHIAAQYGTPDSIKTLIELGANRNLRNISRELPYEIALRWNRTDNAEILRQNSGY